MARETRLYRLIQGMVHYCRGSDVRARWVKVAHRSHAWVVWVITMLFTLMQFLSQLTTGVLAGSFAQTFNLNSLSLGFLVASYYFVYVPMQGPAGMLLDRYGPRVLLSGGALIFSLGSLVLATSGSFWIAVLGRLIMGFGASFAFIGCINTASRWFPRYWVIRLTSVLELVGIGAVLVGDHYLPLGLHILGWRYLMVVVALVAAIVGVCIWGVVRNESPYEQEHKLPKPCHSHNMIRRLGWRKCLFAISRRRSMWINGFYCGIMFSFVSVFSALWGIPYLQHAKALDLVSASRVDNFLLLGVLVGCFFMIIGHRYIKNDVQMMYRSAFLMGVISLSVIFYSHFPIWLIELSLFLIGVISPVYLLNFKVCALLLPDSLRASSTGFTNMMMMAIAPVFQLVFAGAVTLLASVTHNIDAQKIAMMLFPLLIFTAGALIRQIRIPKNRPLR